MDEAQLAGDCIEGIRNAMPTGTEIRTDGGALRPGEPRVEGWLHLAGHWGTLGVPFEVKRRITPAVLALRGRDVQRDEGDVAAREPRRVLFTEYVNMRQAMTLREGGTAFADTHGNVHLWGTGLYVWVTGNKPPTRRRYTPKLLRPAPARVLFTLLQDPTRAQAPYREIAALAGVAPDTVRLVFQYLQHKGLLRVWGPRKRVLTRFPEIVELWAVAYEETLRPKLEPRRYRRGRTEPLLDLNQELRARKPDATVLLGGEVAAALITDALRPATAVLHAAPGDRRAVMKALRLVPHPDGEVTILDIFGTTNRWAKATGAEAPMADPLLVHAELLRTGDDRARTVAAEIYDEHITPRFPRD